MIGVPIGMLVSALLLDALAMGLQAENWLPAAATLTVVGTVLLALSAIPGFVDYNNVVPQSGPVRRLATRHMVFGLGLMGLFLASSIVHVLAWRGYDPAIVSTAFWLNLVGTLGLGFQGYLGGELVYKGHVAVVEGEPLAKRPETQGAVSRREPKRQRHGRRSPLRG